ncbi:hypothetical protein [uncultured Rikenella sp.]|uniref:plasmid mobilization protein n=1 Tax=uncultured Rikenella sp. TaxID=368003 RepID=UPI00262242DB|nr:hypothetical protein [uncultured Rikenella sp.]
MKALDNGRRTCHKEIQFSKEELSEIKCKAHAANMSPAVFIREAALGKELKTAVSDDDRAMWRRASEVSRGLQINFNQLAHRTNIEGLHPLAETNKEMIARIDHYFRTGEWHAINFVDVKREQTIIAELEEEIRRLREQVKEAKDDTLYFYLRTKAGDEAFRRKNNCTIYPDNAGVRWWFKYRDEPAFELPQNIIDKYHNNVLSIRDVLNYWAEHRE